MQPKMKSRKKRAAYATLSNIYKAILLHKEGKFNPPIDANKLLALEIPEWDVFHVVHSLEDLTLTRDGYPTDTFTRLASAFQTDQVEYQKLLTSLLRDAYADVFQHFSNFDNLTHVSREQYNMAFKDYEFPKQRRKMITVFKGLCREAGIIDETTPDESEASQAESAQNTDTPSLISPLDDGPLVVEEDTPVTELSQPNGSHPSQSDITRVKKLVASFVRLDQLARNANSSEATQAMWIDYVRMSYDLLGDALMQIERTEQ